jgi:streptomycin 6-kinase
VIPESMTAFAARHGESGAAWIARLPALVTTYSSRWDVELETTLQLPGSDSAAWVGAGTRADGMKVVLKIMWPHKEAATEAAGLRYFGGRGAVQLLEADEPQFALLVERCLPGDDVWQLPFEEASRVAAGVLERLWRVPDGMVDPIITLADTVDEWNATYATERPEYPPRLVADAARLGAELAAARSELGVVHGDFNPFNILRAQREPWLAIDPKPLLGDPAYDLAQYLANYSELAYSRGDPQAFFRVAIASFSAALALDRHRIAAWAFVKAIGWTWSVQLAELFRELADDAV